MFRESNQKTCKLILLFVVVTSLIITCQYFNVSEVLRNTLIWIKNLGLWSPIIFIILYNLATLILIPGVVLTMGGGVIFGVFLGSIYVFFASTW